MYTYNLLSNTLTKIGWTDGQMYDKAKSKTLTVEFQ